MGRVLRTWLFCTVMTFVVVWPGAVPALAMCIGPDHDPHLVLMGVNHNESVPHDHQHGVHGDTEITACCHNELCLDVPVAFLLDGSRQDPVGCARLALPVGDCWSEVLVEELRVTPAGSDALERFSHTTPVRLNC